ncbi:MAG: cupin domain-containing protein [Patescibacteria group bacterium]
MKIIRLQNFPKVPASHEDPVDPGVLKQILFRRDDLAPGRIQMINWSTLLPGKSFRSHYHEAMDEVFIILDGEVEISVGEEKAILGKGDAVVIPEKTVHVMKNLTNEEVWYIALGISRGPGGKTVVV